MQPILPFLTYSSVNFGIRIQLYNYHNQNVPLKKKSWKCFVVGPFPSHVSFLRGGVNALLFLLCKKFILLISFTVSYIYTVYCDYIHPHYPLWSTSFSLSTPYSPQLVSRGCRKACQERMEPRRYFLCLWWQVEGPSLVKVTIAAVCNCNGSVMSWWQYFVTLSLLPPVL